MSHLHARFVVSERSYDVAPSRERHPFYQAVLPQRGRLEMRIADERGCAGETSFALVPTEAEHTYWASGPNRFLILDLAPALIAVVQQNLEHSTSHRTGAFPPLDERLVALATLLRAELARGGLAEPLIVESLGLYAGSVLFGRGTAAVPTGISTSGAQRLARRTRDFLDASYDQPLLLSEIAAVVGASVSHMQRCFRSHLGMTIIGYVQTRRLARARELLLASDLAIGEVAFAAGFNDQSYFTRLFTREVGLSPSRYRAALRARSGKQSRE